MIFVPVTQLKRLWKYFPLRIEGPRPPLAIRLWPAPEPITLLGTCVKCETRFSRCVFSMLLSINWCVQGNAIWSAVLYRYSSRRWPAQKRSTDIFATTSRTNSTAMHAGKSDSFCFRVVCQRRNDTYDLVWHSGGVVEGSRERMIDISWFQELIPYRYSSCCCCSSSCFCCQKSVSSTNSAWSRDAVW